MGTRKIKRGLFGLGRRRTTARGNESRLAAGQSARRGRRVPDLPLAVEQGPGAVAGVQQTSFAVRSKNRPAKYVELPSFARITGGTVTTFLPTAPPSSKGARRWSGPSAGINGVPRPNRGSGAGVPGLRQDRP